MTPLPRFFFIAVIGSALALASPALAADKKGGPNPSEKVSHDVSLRMVHKGTPLADTIEAYNANNGYDAYVTFEYQKVATGAKAPETVTAREKVEYNKPITVVNGGTKFKILGCDIKNVELRAKTL